MQVRLEGGFGKKFAGDCLPIISQTEDMSNVVQGSVGFNILEFLEEDGDGVQPYLF